MANNIGYLTSSKTPEHQELYTPYYAVKPIVKYIPKSYRIWCPFDAEWSSFYQTFRENGFDVIRSHIDEGKDFFLYEPGDYDVIISNPPFNIKDQILERLYNLNKPFAVLLPLNTLQGKTRYKYFKNGIQILSFDQRIGFHNRQNMNFIYLLHQHTYEYFSISFSVPPYLLYGEALFCRTAHLPIISCICSASLCYYLSPRSTGTYATGSMQEFQACHFPLQI